MLIALVAVQAALAVSVVVVAALRTRAVLFEGALDGRPYRRALAAAWGEGDLAEARRLVDGAPGAWLASLGAVALEARDEGEPPEIALTERLAEVREEATSGLLWLRAATRLGPMLGLLTVAVSFVTSPIAERPAVLGEALTALVAGVVTGFVAADAFRSIAGEAYAQIREAHRLVDALDREVSA